MSGMLDFLKRKNGEIKLSIGKECKVKLKEIQILGDIVLHVKTQKSHTNYYFKYQDKYYFFITSPIYKKPGRKRIVDILQNISVRAIENSVTLKNLQDCRSFSQIEINLKNIKLCITVRL